mgnify:CR=1 FL=1
MSGRNFQKRKKKKEKSPKMQSRLADETEGARMEMAKKIAVAPTFVATVSNNTVERRRRRRERECVSESHRVRERECVGKRERERERESESHRV